MLLELTEVHAYYGDSHILKGVSLGVEEGTCVCLVGRNGMGKTTTMRTCMGLTAPRLGEIRFKGQRTNGLAPYQIAALGVGYVPEERRPFTTLSVAQNLAVATRSRAGVAFWTTEQVFEYFPRLKERANQKAGTMSGGEQQMLAIARALMGNPKLLLLDEPSQGLSPLVIRMVLEAIQKIKATGVTILMSEQNLELAKALSDYFYFISKGQVVHKCSREEFLADENRARQFIMLQ